MTQILEQIAYWLSSYATGVDVDDMCALEGVVRADDALTEDGDPHMLAQINGDLISVLDIRGARKLVGRDDFEVMGTNFARIVEKMCRAGSGNQHSFAIGFRSDPSQARTIISRIMKPQVQTASGFGITDLRMLKERHDALVRCCTDESVYLVVRTHAEDLTAHERKVRADTKRRIGIHLRKIKAGGMQFPMGVSQTIPLPLGALVPRHHAAVRTMVDDLRANLSAGGAQLLVTLVNAHDAVASMRRHLDARPVPAGWKPRLFGDKNSRLGGAAFATMTDDAHITPTRLARQVINGPIDDDFGVRELAYYGEHWYGSVILEICPDNGSEPFSDLAARIGRQIPWRVSFEINPNGTRVRQMERTLAAFLGAVGDYNKGIRKAFDQLKELQNEGTYICSLRMVLTTWAKTKEQALVNLSNLSSSVESWGAAGCTNETGEPGRAMMASSAAFSAVSPAPFLPAPIAEVARMVPFSRPASIWDRGQIIFSTLEGRPYPVEFGSGLQNYWATIGFAPTGSGKSFTLNVLNSGLLLAPGATEVPPITLVDVGHSGALVMEWFKSILPDRLKEQVLAVTLRNTDEYVVNPFDTQHGFDEPMTTDVDFLVAVLGTMSPGCGPEAAKFFERVVRAAYVRYARISPDSRRWQNAYDEKVAIALMNINYVVTDKTRVWQVVDALFEAGYLDESISAQRFAMPTLADLPKVAADASVANVYGNAAHNGERIIDIFTRNIVASLDTYKLLSNFTKFNLGAARAVSIDLQEVVGSMTSEEGRRRSGIMFLLARRIGARNYFLKWDEMSRECPPAYAKYHETRVAKLWETIKFLQYDECHYFSGIEAVVGLVRSDLRTGRKFNLVSAMFSQQLEDFDATVLDNSYIVFVMGMGDASPMKVKDAFALSDDEMQSISSHCIRPGTMFARFRTRFGTLSQIVRLNVSGYEQWAFTTQGKDPALRAALSKYLPRNEAIGLLTDLFPSGTAEPFFRRMLAERAGLRDDDSSLAEMAAKELLIRHAKMADVGANRANPGTSVSP